MPIVLETFKEFAERNGDYIQARVLMGAFTVDGLLFENGATSNGDTTHVEPPEDPFTLARLQLRYYETKLKWSEQDFNRAKINILSGYPSEQQIDQLKKLRIPVLAHRARIKTLREILADSPEAIERKRRAEREQKQEAERQRMLDKARQIEI